MKQQKQRSATKAGSSRAASAPGPARIALPPQQGEQGPKDAAPSGLLAGVAYTDISPPLGIPQVLWGAALHVEADGLDPVGMRVTALVLSDGRQKFAIVDIDAVSVDETIVAAVQLAAEQTGIPAAHIRTGASHSHSPAALYFDGGPAGADLHGYVPILQRYKAAVADKIVGVIRQADGQLRPVHMYGGRGIGTININRRFRDPVGGQLAVGLNFEGFVDREMVVFRIDDAQGNPYAVLVNYQAHPTILGAPNRKISPDYPGSMRKMVEIIMPGATALFLQGAAGNQGPIEGFTGDLNVAHRLGGILGSAAAAVALGIETVDRAPKFEGYVESRAYQAKQYWRVSGPRDQTLRFATKLVDAPPRAYTPAEVRNMAQQVKDAKQRVDELKSGSDPKRSYQAEARLRRFSTLLERWQTPQSKAPVKVQLQVLRIGTLAIVSMPGEPFAEIGAAVKQASPFAFTMFCGYGSGIGGGYVPTAEEFDKGGYEVESTPYGRGAAEVIIQAAKKLLAEVR